MFRLRLTCTYVWYCLIYTAEDETSVCGLPGCEKLCYVENYGKVHDFCCKSHVEEYKRLVDEIERGTGKKSSHDNHDSKTSGGTKGSGPTSSSSSSTGSSGNLT